MGFLNHQQYFIWKACTVEGPQTSTENTTGGITGISITGIIGIDPLAMFVPKTNGLKLNPKVRIGYWYAALTY